MLSTLKKTPLWLFATVLLWMKTFLVYFAGLSINVENMLQAVILFINPLSFILFVFLFSLFMKEKRRNRYILGASFLMSFVLYANVVYHRFFNDFITLPVLFQTSNMGKLGSSVTELIHVTDLWMFIDVAIIAVALWKKWSVTNFVPSTKKTRRLYYVSLVAIVILNLGLAEIERPQLLTRTFDREMLVKNIGTYNYHIYDFVLQSKAKAQRAFADTSEYGKIENYVRANEKKPNDKLFGIAKGRNVIVVSMESLQTFVINNKLNNEEITPFLNSFIKQSYYFENLYHQTGQGKTSDAEFLIDNSLYPLGRGAVFFTNSNNEFHATPEILKQRGYETSVLHANNKSFWNRDIIYPNLGYNQFFDEKSYVINDKNSIGWGLKDKEFFTQSIELLKQQKQPFYSKIITLTNHFPFELAEEDKTLQEFNSDSTTLNRYFTTVRYLDEAMKQFVQQLKDNGLYDNSVLVFYGDHYGISENHNAAMGQYLGKEVTPFESVQLQRVPVFIHIPGVTDKKPQTISKVSGQIDVKPTLLHLLGVETKSDIHFGQDMFSPDKEDFVILRDGSFITKDAVYKEGVCYDKATGLASEDGAACKPYEERVKTELELSDKIIYGDLLRFYKGGIKTQKEE